MDLNKLRNKLIVLEGSEELGKTSVGTVLVDYLNKNNIPAIFSFQPGDTAYSPIATLVRSICKDKRWNLHPLSNLFMFLFDRSECISKVVIPALEAGKTVISDRWTYSSFAYQLHGKELVTKYNMPENVLEWLTESAVLGRKPDYTLYFTKKVGTRHNDDNDMFDHANREFFDRVHAAYERLAQRDNWIYIYAGNTVQETVDNILELLAGDGGVQLIDEEFEINVTTAK
jgi:dTMP kinase